MNHICFVLLVLIMKEKDIFNVMYHFYYYIKNA